MIKCLGCDIESDGCRLWVTIQRNLMRNVHASGGNSYIPTHADPMKEMQFPTYTKVTPRDVDNPVWGRDTYDEPLAEAIPNDTPIEEFHEWYTDEK